MTSAQCPVCDQTLTVRPERLVLHGEVLCSSCGSMLEITAVDPLKLVEIDLD